MPATAAQQIILPAPHPGQRIVREHAQRFNWLCAGRRWRKTTLALPIAVEASLTRRGDYLWGAPTFRQVRVGWDELRKATGAVFAYNESRMVATTPNGSRLFFLSLDDPDNARGLTLMGAVFDEASEIPERAWAEVVRPMLLDTGGWAWMLYTPKGRNWTWVGWQQAQERPQDSAAWQIPSLGCAIVDGQLVRQPHPLENPSLDFGELRQIFETTPERVFRQEILAEFLDDAGGVFRGVEACVGGALEAEPPHRLQQYAIGVDLAKYHDYTVCCVGDLREKRMVAFDRYNRADWPLQVERIKALAQTWNDAILWVDSTGVGDPICDALMRAGCRVQPYHLTAPSKRVLIDNAVVTVEQRQVMFPRIEPLVRELKNYEYQRTTAGGLRMNAPEGLYDDCVIAFSLMCWPMVNTSSAHFDQQTLDAWRKPASEIGGVSILRKTF